MQVVMFPRHYNCLMRNSLQMRLLCPTVYSLVIIYPYKLNLIYIPYENCNQLIYGTIKKQIATNRLRTQANQ